MILRLLAPSPLEQSEPAWQAFEATQQLSRQHAGCITQPAHAALSRQIAADLDPSLFGELPPEVLDTIGRHDAGWAGPDLASLEHASEYPPLSFLAIPPAKAVLAWRESIRSAERRSPLAGILTSRHFTLLDPDDGDPHHDRFRAEEAAQRQSTEKASPVAPADIDRYTTALGFCDLLSLCLVSGLEGSIRLPKAHPADPASSSAPHVTLTLDDGAITSTSEPTLRPGAHLSVTAWLFTGTSLTSTTLTWTSA